MTEPLPLQGYITSRAFQGNRAAQAVQNLVIRDYARRAGLDFRLSGTEYAMPGSTMMLRQLVDALGSQLGGIILYSLFQLPGDQARRHDVYARVIAAGANLHCALEGLVIADADDARQAEDIWLVNQATAPRDFGVMA